MVEEDFDISSLAAYLHLTPQQVEKLANRGRIPSRRIGGKLRFSPAEIHHWMEDRMGVLDDVELAEVETRLRPIPGRPVRPCDLPSNDGFRPAKIAASTNSS